MQFIEFSAKQITKIVLKNQGNLFCHIMPWFSMYEPEKAGN